MPRLYSAAERRPGAVSRRSATEAKAPAASAGVDRDYLPGGKENRAKTQASPGGALAPADGTGPASRPELSGQLRDGTRVIKMTAKQFQYDPATVVVALGDRVKIEATSLDVPHGFQLDDFGIKQKVEPDATTTITFVADKAGTHEFHCSVFCGEGHGEMKGELVVLPGPK